MKELSVEEKAKRYDEAIERAKELLEIGVKDTRDKRVVLSFFPELKESEDERIRKAIITYLKQRRDRSSSIPAAIGSWIDWLEKHKDCETEIELAYKNQDEVVYNRGFNDGYKCGFQADITEEDIQKAASKYIDEEQSIFFEGVAYGQKHQTKPEWSEEDKKMFARFAACLGYHYNDGIMTRKEYEEAHNFLKSLKDRVQPKREWSKKDNQYLCGLIGLIEQSKAGLPITLKGKAADNCINWLKSLRPQNWTKEDKERYISCLQRLGTGNPEQPETINSKWFKEHVYPQSTWKPSEEQMTDLLQACNFFNANLNPLGGRLNILLEQLKKLTEE